VQEYKPPAIKDIPIDLRVTLLPNSPNPVGVLRSKGEPVCALVVLGLPMRPSTPMFTGVSLWRAAAVHGL
jgi:hypothetical protein